ncbi:hypothetical protein pVco5_070 [Vibrio phage pVco-5]|uniref:Uncharacterized protein n=1 Tax=Vibrio phage pVco-5 TaxID=1965485 RepID=A0A1W6JUV9_9CAUD|nr:hypothetical protein KNT61_gp070 [Vibrio phage pVco-5]ARM71058.1 hypothetical protein pVco5_070 [Vibrio phage pVco-5]
MEIQVSKKMQHVHFTISGRSDGGTAKTTHLMDAHEAFVKEFGANQTVSIVIYLESGIHKVNKGSAKSVIFGYKRAAKKLVEFVQSQGNPNFEINLQFIKAF